MVFSMTYRHAASTRHAGELGAGGSVGGKKKGTLSLCQANCLVVIRTRCSGENPPLCCQAGCAIPLEPPSLGQLVGADRFVAAGPSLPSLGIAPKFPTDRGWRPAQGRRNLVLRYTACGISHALLKAELAITSSHRNNTLAGVALAS